MSSPVWLPQLKSTLPAVSLNVGASTTFWGAVSVHLIHVMKVVNRIPASQERRLGTPFTEGLERRFLILEATCVALFLKQ